MASPWTIILAAIALVCVAGGEVTVTDGDAPDVYLAKVRLHPHCCPSP